MKSNKASRADNQQERLALVGWILGFVDGEGCFTVSFFTHPKSRLRLKWEVFPEFVISQGKRSMKALESIRKFFGCGGLYQNRRHDNHHEHMMKYVVRNREDLLERIIPFFEKYPLKTAKKNDFRIFAKIVRMMAKGQHLQEKGLERIRTMVMKMNTRKYR